VSAGAIETLVAEIEADLRRQEGQEVSHAALGEMVMNRLRALDNVAYIRFASVYRAFADLSSFEEEIQRAKGVDGEAEVGSQGGEPALTR